MLRIVAAAVAWVVMGVGLPDTATADIIEWQVGDHPGGGLALPTYMLRLGTDATHPNTFTVETSGTGATFQFDPTGVAINTDQAKLVGTIQHNRDSTGPISGGFYSIDATFTTVQFTDPDAANWYDPNPNNMVYDDMLIDLLNMSDDTPFNIESFTTDADRIYFQLIDMILTHTGGTDTYTGPPMWDEFPNSTDKQFFIQLNHRTSSNVLAAAGWLEVFEDAGRERTSDFLFTLKPVPVPEPTSLSLLSAGLILMGLWGRRRLLTRADRSWTSWTWMQRRF